MTLCYHTSVDLVKEGKLQMRIRFVCFVIIFLGALVLITGCGEEDITEPEAEIVEPEDPCLQKGPPPASQFVVQPAAGATISSTQQFTLDFDTAFGQITEVTVNGIAATDTKAGGLFSSVWVVSLILEPGTRTLSVEWTESDGCMRSQAVGPYTVVADED